MFHQGPHEWHGWACRQLCTNKLSWKNHVMQPNHLWFGVQHTSRCANIVYCTATDMLEAFISPMYATATFMVDFCDITISRSLWLRWCLDNIFWVPTRVSASLHQPQVPIRRVHVECVHKQHCVAAQLSTARFLAFNKSTVYCGSHAFSSIISHWHVADIRSHKTHTSKSPGRRKLSQIEDVL
jgi:hypothetical protein